MQVLNPSVQDRVTNRLHYRHGGDDKGKAEQDCRDNKPPGDSDNASNPEHDGSRDGADAQDETNERGHQQEDLANPGNVGNSAGKRSDVLFLMLCHCLLGLSGGFCMLPAFLLTHSCSFSILSYFQAQVQFKACDAGDRICESILCCMSLLFLSTGTYA